MSDPTTDHIRAVLMVDTLLRIANYGVGRVNEAHIRIFHKETINMAEETLKQLFGENYNDGAQEFIRNRL